MGTRSILTGIILRIKKRNNKRKLYYLVFSYSKCNKILVTQIYEEATNKTVIKFLTEAVLQDFLFNVKEVQIYSGSEFKAFTLKILY